MVEKRLLDSEGSVLGAFGLKPVLDRVFDGVADEVDRSPKSEADGGALVYVTNLRMMYGGGHLLLKELSQGGGRS